MRLYILRMILVFMIAGMVIQTLSAQAESYDPEVLMKALIHARAICESQGGGAHEARIRLNPSKDKAASNQCIILVEQVFWSESVVVLVYDPTALANKSVMIEVFEGVKGFPNKGKMIQLLQAYPGSAIFIATFTVEGSHGTRVKASYRTQAGNMIKIAETFMAFH